MASSSSLRSASRPHQRHQYQMLNSKDDDEVRVGYSVGNESEEERGPTAREDDERDGLSWKKMVRLDLTLSRHRDT